jgi:ferric-dicitrate binding protein FerR (iron transport regulator)
MPPGGQPPSDRRKSLREMILRCLLCASGAILLSPLPFLPFIEHLSPDELYTTRVGEQRSISLGTGSDALLNTNTALRLRRTVELNRVELLRGEVFFEIRNWHGHLIVSAGGVEIKDVGTAFVVKLLDDGTVRVTVQRGEVTASGAHVPETAIYRNQQATIDGRDHPQSLQKRSFSAKEIQDQLEWRHGVLVFHCEAIGTVVQEFNRYNDDKIEIADVYFPQRIQGAFSATDPSAFTRALQLTVSDLVLETEESADGHHIFRLRQLPPERQPHVTHIAPVPQCH